MAYSIHHNVTPSSETGLEIEASYIDTADYAATTNVAGDFQMSNVTSPLGRPETIGYKFSTINDIYASSGIEKALWAPTRRGVSLLVQVKQTWTVSDDSDASAPEYAFPVTCNLTIKTLQHPLISEADIEALLKEALGSMLCVDGEKRISFLLRGSLDPT